VAACANSGSTALSTIRRALLAVASADAYSNA
jgi:hypothetical protein